MLVQTEEMESSHGANEAKEHNKRGEYTGRWRGTPNTAGKHDLE